MKKLNIHFADDNGTIAPLFHQYPTQINPQPAYLEFNPGDDDDEMTLTAEYNAEIGNGIPANVFNRKILRWSIPSSVHRQSLMELAEHGPLIDTLNTIRAGYDCETRISAAFTPKKHSKRSIPFSAFLMILSILPASGLQTNGLVRLQSIWSN